MNVVCLVLDRLHAGYLGCYGNTWVVTPSFDRLAAEAFTFDQALCDRPTLAGFYRAAWFGRHAAEPDGAAPEHVSLPERFRRAGFATIFATDDTERLPGWLSGEVDHWENISPPPVSARATAMHETHLAQVFAAATEHLEDLQHDRPTLLWLHVGSLGQAWDAPVENILAHGDEEDPPPLDSIAVPHARLGASFDFDERWRHVQAYAGQITLLDACLGGFLEAFDSSVAPRGAALLLVSPRGIALGAHGLVGAEPDELAPAPLHGELTRMACLIRSPLHDSASGCRSAALAQTPDLMWTLCDLAQLSAAPESGQAGRSLLPILRDEAEQVRDRAVILGADGERALRTASWYARWPTVEPPRTQLYAMPDDYWEVNEVSNRCESIAESLTAAVGEWTDLAGRGALDQMRPLDAEVAESVR